MTHKKTTPSKDQNQIQSTPQEKLKGIKITDNISDISQEKIANIILPVCNPNNNAAFEERSNPLSSKGN